MALRTRWHHSFVLIRAVRTPLADPKRGTIQGHPSVVSLKRIRDPANSLAQLRARGHHRVDHRRHSHGLCSSPPPCRYGTIVSHNVPPYGRAGLYKQLTQLKDLLAEYREAPPGGPFGGEVHGVGGRRDL